MLHFILLRSFVQIYQYSISPNAFQRLQNRLNQKGSSPYCFHYIDTIKILSSFIIIIYHQTYMTFLGTFEIIILGPDCLDLTILKITGKISVVI